MRSWLAVALMTAVALSGCADESGTEGTDGAGGGDGGSGSDGDGNETAGGGSGSGGEATGNETGNATNEVPVVTFTADVLNGTAPLLVNFTLSVEDDSQNLSWALLIDGNETLSGEGATAAFNHTFDAGKSSAAITVTDGEHTVSQTINVTATAPLPEDPEPICGEDPADRGGTPADILGICVSVDDPARVVYMIELADNTGIDGCAEYPLTWGVYPGGASSPIEVYCFLGLAVANWAGGQAFDTEATVTLEGTSLVITIPIAELEDLDVTSFYGESWNGPGAYGGRPMWIPGSEVGESIAIDRAPDSGTFGG